MNESTETANGTAVAGRDSSELLASALSNEAQLWGMAPDHDHLRSMWERRITKETHDLNDQQAKAVEIAQACAYALATQQIAIRMMGEMAGLIRLYAEFKGS